MTDPIYSLERLGRAAPLFARSAVAIGNFDGVHRGHVRVLTAAVEAAGTRGMTAVALTFDPHPRAVVGAGPPPALAGAAARRNLIEALGVEATVALRFDREVAGLTPERFVRQVLVEGLGARHVVVGDNFRFGRRAEGTTARLAELGRRHGFTVQIVAPVRDGDVVISSSVIRRRLQAGDVEGAAALLGRPYEVSGPVVAGEGRGASLGFATANVEPAADALLPGPGVYAGRTLGRPAVAIVGDKPTFRYGETVLEVHLLDFDASLLGRRLTIAFLRRLRDVKTFGTVAALQGQMAEDVARVRRLFREGMLFQDAGGAG